MTCRRDIRKPDTSGKEPTMNRTHGPPTRAANTTNLWSHQLNPGAAGTSIQIHQTFTGTPTAAA